MTAASNNRSKRTLWWIVLGLFVLGFPFILPFPYLHNVAILILIWVVIGASWNLLGGYTGQVSFGHAVYFGAGAYAGAILKLHWGVSAWWGLLVGGLAGMAAAVLIGWVCFRLRGPYFALGTLASGEMFHYAFINLEPLTGGEEGIVVGGKFLQAMVESPPMWTLKIPFYYIILLIAAGCVLTIHFVLKTKLGYYFVSIREDQDAAESLGIPTTFYKNVSLQISAFFTGLAGAFYTVYMGHIDPTVVFNLHYVSIMAIMVVMVGGTALQWGPVAGAMIMVGIEELFRSRLFGLLGGGVGDIVAKGDILVFGVIVVLVILFMPNGVAGDWRKFIRKSGAKA